MGAGLSAEDFGLESPQGRYQLTKYTDSQNIRITPGLYYKAKVLKQTFLNEQITSLYSVHSVEHLFSSSDAVSPLKRKHTLVWRDP